MFFCCYNFELAYYSTGKESFSFTNIAVLQKYDMGTGADEGKHDIVIEGRRPSLTHRKPEYWRQSEWSPKTS